MEQIRKEKLGEIVFIGLTIRFKVVHSEKNGYFLDYMLNLGEIKM